MPRPSSFTPDRAAEAVRRAGSDSQEWVAYTAGVSRRTLQRWLAAGRDGVEPFAAFAAAFDERAGLRRLARLQAYWRQQEARDRARWQEFRRERARWWMDRLGPVEFWRRRLRWAIDHNREACAERAAEELERVLAPSIHHKNAPHGGPIAFKAPGVPCTAFRGPPG